MAFKIKDLMITVLPERGGGAGKLICQGCTFPNSCGVAGGSICQGCTNSCGVQGSGCGGCSFPNTCGIAGGSICQGCTNSCGVQGSGCVGCSFPNTCGVVGGSVCQGCTNSCGVQGSCIGTGGGGGGCDPFSCFDTCPGITLTIILRQQRETSSEALATLKEQLKQALAQVEVQERAMDESLKPQSIDEVDQLEQKLTEALNELRTRRQELQQKASEQPE